MTSTQVKDEILGILAYGATPVGSVEAFLHGEDRRSVGEVIRAHPDLFHVFERGFDPRTRWVRLARPGDGRPDGHRGDLDRAAARWKDRSPP